MQNNRYRNFSQRMFDQVRTDRLPLQGSIEVTERCNLQCAHCHINKCARDRDARQQELSLAEHQRLLDELADEGCLWLLYTGGEIFLRPDFLDIYVYAKRKGILPTLFTNGVMITDTIADQLAEWTPFSVEITLYGHSQAVYEQVTGVPGSHRRCRRGIERLLKRGVPLSLKSVAISLNVHELPEMEAYADSLGIPFRFDSDINGRLDGVAETNQPARTRLTPEQVVALDTDRPDRLAEWREVFERNGGRPQHSGDLYYCGAGISTFHVDAYGRLSVCLVSRTHSYDLRGGSFHEGWYEFIPAIRATQRSRPSQCQTCELHALCGNCAGTAEAEHGDAEQPVEYFHEIAQLRAQALGVLTTAEHPS